MLLLIWHIGLKIRNLDVKLNNKLITMIGNKISNIRYSDLDRDVDDVLHIKICDIINQELMFGLKNYLKNQIKEDLKNEEI